MPVRSSGPLAVDMRHTRRLLNRLAPNTVRRVFVHTRFMTVRINSIVPTTAPSAMTAQGQSLPPAPVLFTCFAGADERR